MRAELEKKLTHEFKFMRRIKEVSNGTHYEWQGCKCGDGWYELIRGFCLDIEELFAANALPVDITMHKIEQHNGTLRIYCYTEHNALRNSLLGIIGHYEFLSEHTCEVCGAKDLFTVNSPVHVCLRKDLAYMQSLCDDCYNKAMEKEKERKARMAQAKTEMSIITKIGENENDEEAEPEYVLLPESDFETEDIEGGCVITGYKGTAGEFYAILPGSINGKPVRAIGNEALAYCDFSYLKLPDSLTSIGSGAFALIFSLRIDIPEGVKEIGDNAFRGCHRLGSITNKGRGKADDYLYIPKNTEKIGKNAFTGCKYTIYICHMNSAMHKYALENCLRYELAGQKSDKENKMRTNQVSVTVGRYGNQIAQGYEEKDNTLYMKLRMQKSKEKAQNPEAAAGTPAGQEVVQALRIYADANNLYEALSAAFNESVYVVRHFDALPKRESDDKYPSGGYNEVSIYAEHFGEDNSFDKYFDAGAYESSANVYEALSLAINTILQEAQKHTTLPIFGRKENYSIQDREDKHGRAVRIR